MNTEIELADYIKSLRNTLRQAAADRGDEEPRFIVGPVQVELETVGVKEASGDGGLRFWVVSLGGSAKSSQSVTQRITLILNPVTADGQPLQIEDELAVRPD